MSKKQELQQLSSNVSPANAEGLRSVFEPYIEQLSSWEEEAKGIVVSSEDDKDGMVKARGLRLRIREARIAVEKKRKTQKADYLAMSRAIDGMANVLKLPMQQLESHLQQQEDYAKIQEEKRAKELAESRLSELQGIAGQEYSATVDLAAIDDATYSALKQGLIAQKEQAEKQAREAEEARIAEQRRKEEEAEQLRLENERLQKEAEERERQVAKEREEREAREAAERKEREAREAEERAKVEAERIERQKHIEAERLAREAAEQKVREQEERERKEQEKREAEARALQEGSDKEMLAAYLERLRDIPAPKFKSKKFKDAFVAFAEQGKKLAALSA